MVIVLSVAQGFFPLDRELELLPGCLTPHLHESLVRLGSWLPFKPTAAMMAALLGVQVSKDTARRWTEAAGAAQVELQEAAVAEMEKGKLPPKQVGLEKMVLSVDGAMVPLVGGEWAEVKTLALGEVTARENKAGEREIHTQHLSYFSRLAAAETFQRLALVETERRGLLQAKAVAAVVDGAEWEQGFIDYHCPAATRILDFPHAAERLTTVQQACATAGSDLGPEWLNERRQQLKAQGGSVVLAHLRTLQQQQPDIPLAEPIAYLSKREKMLVYPEFQDQGWPIGSGCVESANKLVVEARLKGAGMHWQRQHVNSLLALRNIVCSDRWQEAWSPIAQRLRDRHHVQPPATSDATASSPSTTVNVVRQYYQRMQALYPSQKAQESPLKKPYRPPADHPWRRMPVGRARFKSHLAKF